WAEDRRGPAEEQRGPDEEGLRGHVDVRIDIRPERGHDPAERDDDAADDERLHLEREDVLAEGAHRVLVLTDALDDAAPRAAHDRPGEEEDEEDDDDPDDDDPPLVARVRPGADADAPCEWRERIRRPEVRVEPGETVSG